MAHDLNLFSLAAKNCNDQIHRSAMVSNVIQSSAYSFHYSVFFWSVYSLFLLWSLAAYSLVCEKINSLFLFGFLSVIVWAFYFIANSRYYLCIITARVLLLTFLFSTTVPKPLCLLFFNVSITFQLKNVVCVWEPLITAEFVSAYPSPVCSFFWRECLAQGNQ